MTQTDALAIMVMGGMVFVILLLLLNYLCRPPR